MRPAVQLAFAVAVGLGLGWLWYARQPHRPGSLAQAAREAEDIFVYRPYEQPHEWYWSRRSALPETLSAIHAATFGPPAGEPDPEPAYTIELYAKRWGPFVAGDGMWARTDGGRLGSYRWPDGPSLVLSPSIAATFAHLHDPAFAGTMATSWGVEAPTGPPYWHLTRGSMEAWRRAAGKHVVGRAILSAGNQFHVCWRLDTQGAAIQTPAGWEEPADGAARAEMREATAYEVVGAAAEAADRAATQAEKRAAALQRTKAPGGG